LRQRRKEERAQNEGDGCSGNDNLETDYDNDDNKTETRRK
jgi:hypothetical protein